MNAASCPRRFILRADGGVICRWACGAEVVNPAETAIDVAILADRFPHAHHHRHHVRHRAW